MGNSESRPSSREIAEHRAEYNRILDENSQLKAEKALLQNEILTSHVRSQDILSKSRRIDE